MQRGGAPVGLLLAVGFVLLLGLGAAAAAIVWWVSGSTGRGPDAPPAPPPVTAPTDVPASPVPDVPPPVVAPATPPAVDTDRVVTPTVPPPPATPVPDAKPPRPPARPVEPLSARIDRAWSRIRSKVDACKPGPGVATTWKVTAVFDGQGRVTDASAAAQPRDDATGRCLEAAARQLKVDAQGEAGRRVFTVQFPKE